MVVACAALGIVPSGAACGDEVVSFEVPVDVLETVFYDIGMVEKDGTDLPISEVVGVDEGEGIADSGGAAGRVKVFRDDGGEGPVAGAGGVLANGEFLGATGEVDEAGCWIEGGGGAVF